MRAMTLEWLVRDRLFASQTATTTVGALGLDRPTEVVEVDAKVHTGRTADLLKEALDRALEDGAGTLTHAPDVVDLAERFGQHCDRIDQASIFGNVKRSIHLHDAFAREGLERTGRSVVERYHSDFALDYDPGSNS